MGIFSVAFTGRGGKLAQCAGIVFSVPSDDTARIQEAHITLGHIICDLVERTLFPQKAAKS
jgi:D-sedoheptulose 7-phosphate isomerase